MPKTMDQADFIERLKKDGVSIIMLSCYKAQFIEASIRSVLAQTYTNWELLVVDDSSKDGTISKVLRLRDELDNYDAHKIIVSQTVFKRGETINRNSALREARGRWIAFLDAGDVWEPTKLERQVMFMEENGYFFSYMPFRNIDDKQNDSGYIMSGPEYITKKDLLKCCWLGYLTVMYDQKKVGQLQVTGLKEANDYALWLQAIQKADCHLLNECLACQMSPKGLWHRLLTSNKLTWRYETYRKIEGSNPIISAYMAIRNILYTAYKWWKYTKKVKK